MIIKLKMPYISFIIGPRDLRYKNKFLVPGILDMKTNLGIIFKNKMAVILSEWVIAVNATVQYDYVTLLRSFYFHCCLIYQNETATTAVVLFYYKLHGRI